MADIKAYTEELRAQIAEKKRELTRLEAELKRANQLVSSFERKAATLAPAARSEKKTRKPNNLQKIMAVFEASPDQHYRTPELHDAFEALHGTRLKDTTLRSSLTVLRIEGYVDYINKHWAFRKPYTIV